MASYYVVTWAYSIQGLHRYCMVHRRKEALCVKQCGWIRIQSGPDLFARSGRIWIQSRFDQFAGSSWVRKIVPKTVPVWSPIIMPYKDLVGSFAGSRSRGVRRILMVHNL